MEMDLDEVVTYFRLVDRCLKRDGLFFCSNRPVKRTSFFCYPWARPCEYEDIFFEMNELRKDWGNEFFDRLQKKRSNNTQIDTRRSQRGLHQKVYRFLRDQIWRKEIRQRSALLASIRNILFKCYVQVRYLKFR